MKLPDVLNEIFDLPVDWDYSEIEKEIPLSVLEDFSRLSGLIANLSLEREYHAAISFIWKTRKYVGVHEYSSSNFIGTEISANEAVEIMERLGRSESDALNVVAKHARTDPSLSALLLHQDRSAIFEIFLNKERVILRDWGLNQQSTEIVIERIRSFEFRIFLNMITGGSVNSDKISKACIALQRQSKLPVAAYRQGRSGHLARSSLRTNLVRSKDKIIGLATLFGDAAPLALGKGLDVSSYISTAAGATVLAMLPRG